MNKERMIENFLEMLKIHSPSNKEKEYSEYLVKELEKLGAEIYLDNGYVNYGGNAPTIFAKVKGNIDGEGVTLAAHMDVIEPNLNVNPIVAGNTIKTDGTTTLGGDDKAGIASILEAIKTIKEKNLNHKDIFVVFTPCEEAGMLGAKNVDWSLIPEEIKPAKNMIVVDNAGRAGIIAHSAPSKYNFKIVFEGRNAHAGIEPEKGINAISLAALAISKMNTGRIDELTTSNIGSITSNFPTNVVPDLCEIFGEVRSHSEEKIISILDSYKLACDEAINIFGGNYRFEQECDFPVLKPKDDLKFANEFAEIYKTLGVETELKVIGGGSDSNIFAKQGYNSIIVGVGMYDVHTVDERLEIEDLFITTEAIIKYITQ